MSSSQRAHPRVPISVNVNIVINTPEGRTVRAERMGNLSLGGVFIGMEDPPAFGTELSMEFRLASDAAVIRCRGFVAWSTRGKDEAPENRGIGVRLMGLSIADMKALSEYVDEKAARR